MNLGLKADGDVELVTRDSSKAGVRESLSNFNPAGDVSGKGLELERPSMLAALMDHRASKSFFQENPNPDHGVLGMSGVVLAIMSTILGGGMMAIPHATLTVGLIPTIGVAAFAST